MNRLKIVLSGMLFFCFIHCADSQQLILVQNGKSNYQIVISTTPTSNEKLAASELQKYLKLVTGATLQITSNLNGNQQIVIGNDIYIKKIDPSLNSSELEDDGFHIKQKGNILIFAGGREKGVLFAIYSFLESYLNCRLYAPDAIVIPKRDNVILNGIDLKQIPKIKYRETFYWPSNDALYTNWHKVEHFRAGNSLWGNWVHSVLDLVPPNKFFKAHPEYYALSKGKRTASQLCLSNPEVYDIIVNKLKEEISKKPNAKYWSVSQADNANYCQCDLCTAVDAKEGGPSGSIITFVNKVAKAFPDKIINTLAYSYSVKPPKYIKPLSNVLVTFCTSGDLDRGRPYHLEVSNSDYINNMMTWGRISKQFMIWDYVVDYKDYTMPFPNLSAISENLKYFARNNVNALFIHGNYYGGGEFAELKSYLISKLMWNPDANPDYIIKEFLSGYYGMAAPYITKYISELTLNYKESKISLGIFDSPEDHINGYLSVSHLNSYGAILKKAEKAVSANSILLKRVKRITASIDYALLRNGIYNAVALGAITEDKNKNSLYVTKEKEKLNSIYDALKEQNVVRIRETDMTPEQYKEGMLSVIDSTDKIFVPGNLALNKKITLIYPPSPIHAKYAGNNALIDGIKGDLVSGLNTWQGFYGGKFEAVIDLKGPIKVNMVNIDFLKIPSLNVLSPDKIEMYYSVDGINYFQDKNIKMAILGNSKTSEIRGYTLNINSVICRYLKISAFNNTHAMMLTDEIVIK